MPLSTFSSNVFQRATAALLATVLIGGSVIELGARQFIYKMSRDLNRIHTEAAAASTLHPAPGAPKNILLVGNSLLLWGVVVDQLNRETPPMLSVSRYAIQQTTYYDWYFGLRRILADGARPDMIVIGLEPRHLLQDGVRQEFFAHYLMRERDVLEVKEALALNMTDTVDLLFANASTFYALRKEIRKNLLVKLLPTFPDLTALIVRASYPPISREALDTKGRQRLQSLRDAAPSGVQVAVLVMPPVNPTQAQTLRAIGSDIGLPIFTPMTDNELNATYFQADGYHLNEAGREKFTRAFASLLDKQTL